MCPVDTLVHLCVNTGLDGGRRLRGLIDVDTVLQSGRIDVAELTARSHHTGTGRLCAAVLQRASTVLGDRCRRVCSPNCRPVARG